MKNPNHPITAFTLGDLSRRLAVPASALRIAITNGVIECDQQPPGRKQPWAPVISRDAAIKFCVSVGLNPERLMS